MGNLSRLKILIPSILLSSMLFPALVMLDDAVSIVDRFLELKNSACSVREFQNDRWNSEPSYYAITLEPQGFVLVSSDDLIPPILAYSFESSFSEPGPDHPADYLLRVYDKKVNAAQQSIDLSDYWTPTVNDDNPDFRLSRDVAPLTEMLWGQDYPWNGDCPEDENGPGGHALTGCIATCLGQIMKYWEHPVNGIGAHAYIHPDYGTLSADFQNTTYNWAAMADLTATNASQLLIYHAAVAVEMDFGPELSSAPFYAAVVPNAFNVLQDHFGYDPSMQFLQRADYSDEDWHTLLRNELDEGRPFLYDGFSDGIGHSWVIDGYDADGLYHCNWGWEGYLNGYFSLASLTPGELDLTDIQRAIIGIIPSGDIEGCIDEAALNFNPNATVDDGSCEYPLPPQNLTAELMEQYIQLTWESPYENAWLECPDGSAEYADCSGTCFNNADCAEFGYDGCIEGELTWLNDGFCDNGIYGLDFQCQAYFWDYDDCVQSSDCQEIDPLIISPAGCSDSGFNAMHLTWGGGCVVSGLYYGMNNVYQQYFDLSPYNLSSSFNLSGFGPSQTWMFQLVAGDLSSRVVTATTSDEDCSNRVDSYDPDPVLQITPEIELHPVDIWENDTPVLRFALTGFNIYRSDVSGSEYELLATADPDSVHFEDVNILEDHSYYYVITAVLDSYYESPYSNEASVISEISGCTDPAAWNYNPEATFDDGSCEEGIPGDVNHDSTQDILDIVQLIFIILNPVELSEYEQWAGDVNGDSVIDILDIVMLVSIILAD